MTPAKAQNPAPEPAAGTCWMRQHLLRIPIVSPAKTGTALPIDAPSQLQVCNS